MKNVQKLFLPYLIYHKCYTSPCKAAFTTIKSPIDAGNS